MADIKEVVNHIRATINILFIRTYEEQRFTDDLLAELGAATEFSMEVLSWSSASGLTNLTTDEPDEVDVKQPQQILSKIAAYEVNLEKSGAVFILKDFNYLLINSIPRQLKDLINSAELGNKRLIILSPELNIGNIKYPAILDKDTVVLDYDLLTESQIRQELESAVRDLNEDNYIGADLSYSSQEIDALTASARGLTHTELSQALSLSLVKEKRLTYETINSLKKDIVRKRGILEYIDIDVSMDDVGGLAEAKKYIDVYSKSFSREAKEANVEAPKGIILTGVPGAGKSLLAKTCASRWKMPCLRLDIGRVMSGVVGSSEENIRNALKLAEATAPVVLWLDEIEKSVSGVKSSNFSDSGTTSRVFGTLLTWMQENTADVVVIATANDITQVPVELIRRFDEVFFVDLPLANERAEIFKIHLKKRNQELKSLDMKALVHASKEYTGAEIEKAIRFGLAKAFYDGAKKLTTDHILKALEETSPVSRVMQQQVEALREWAVGRARYAATPRSVTNPANGVKPTENKPKRIL